MNDPELPEDVNRWPKDPYQLLGVTPEVQPKELRRIYTRLIRAYKPEQQPEQFRRIREAYEAVLRQVEFFQSYPGHAPEPAAENAAPATPWRQPPVDEAADRLWEQACAGQEIEAYRGLAQLLEAQPQRADLRLRLYWLLTLNPELDDDRFPGDWLVPGLVLGGVSGPLWELYRREIWDDPDEAITERFQKLLELPLTSATLTDVLECGWQAVSRLGRADLIYQDLEQFAAQYRMDDDNYLRLLITALEQAAPLDSLPARQIVQRVKGEVKRFEHDQIRLAAGLDRLEFLLEIAAGLNQLRTWRTPPASMLRLVALSLARPFIEVRALVWEFLAEMARDTGAAVPFLDAVRQHAPAVLSQLEIVLMLLENTLPPLPDETRSAAELAELVERFLDRQDRWQTYATYRQQFLTYCKQEALPPDLLDQAANDWSVRFVWQCSRLFEQ